jgi:hypothetical protein
MVARLEQARATMMDQVRVWGLAGAMHMQSA